MYSYNEAFNASKDYFNGDELAANVFLSKYALRDNNDELVEKTPEDMHKRIAKEFARIEKDKFKEPMSEEFIFNLLKDFKYIVPQGSPMYGIGNHYREISLSNCYVTDSPNDNYSSILDVDKQIVNISKRRGGVGVNLDNLRPAGAKVNNAARTSTGIISWMERYSNSIREVGQNGRRGALMETISIRHPDSVKLDDVDFCSVKLDKTKVTGANVSIKIDDDFMNCVVSNKDYMQKWPINSDNPEVTKIINAKKAWNKIIDCAHSSAEPGIVFWDNVHNYGVADIYSKYKSDGLNPCLHRDTLIATENGLERIIDLYKKQTVNYVTCDTRINKNNINENNFGIKVRKATKVKLTQQNAKLYKVSTNYGYSVIATDNHTFITKDGRKQLKELKTGDILLLQSEKGYFGSYGDYEDGLILGLITSDGFISNDNRAFFEVWEDDFESLNKIKKAIKEKMFMIEVKHHNRKSESYDVDYQVQTEVNKKKKRIGGRRLYKYIERLIKDKPESIKNRVPEVLYSGSEEFVKGYLHGFFFGDGSINVSSKKSCVSLRFCQSNKELLEQIQVLVSNFGIYGSVTLRRKAGYRNLPNSQRVMTPYLCKDYYEFIINKPCAIKFADEIGFFGRKKKDWKQKISQLTKHTYTTKYETKIKSIEYYGNDDVFCLTEPETNSIITNGIINGQCAELTLCSLDSCRLLLLNVFSFVENPFTRKSSFNFKKFYEYAQYAQRLMDDLVDLESECIKKILKKIKKQYNEGCKELNDEIKMWEKILDLNSNGRRTGTGVTAIGDTLAALGIKYGSDKSIEIVEKIYMVLKLGCYRSSVDMAKELGTFDIWNSSLEKGH